MQGADRNLAARGPVCQELSSNPSRHHHFYCLSVSTHSSVSRETCSVLPSARVWPAALINRPSATAGTLQEVRREGGGCAVPEPRRDNFLQRQWPALPKAAHRASHTRTKISTQELAISREGSVWRTGQKLRRCSGLRVEQKQRCGQTTPWRSLGGKVKDWLLERPRGTGRIVFKIG